MSYFLIIILWNVILQAQKNANRFCSQQKMIDFVNERNYSSILKIQVWTNLANKKYS